MEYELSKTKEFDKWMNYLKDPVTKARIARRIKNMKFGHFGDHKKISPDLFEIRFFFGSGYRIYYTIKNNQVILLLSGGDKSTQQKDIERAKQILNK